MDSEISHRVREFYEALPFNYYGSVSQSVAQIKMNPLRTCPDLTGLISSSEINSILDIGCGIGWFANTVAYLYSKSVVGVDMTARAIERANQIAECLGVSDHTTFVRADLFDFRFERPVDLIASIGVLHHTFSARKAFHHIQQFVGDHGYIYLGLYHLYGRQVFLDIFREVLGFKGEDAAFQKYRALHSTIEDESLLRSWFRDQVLHPHESLHTLGEVLGWLDECGFVLRRTSINDYKDFRNSTDLIQMERAYEAISRRRNTIENSYYPGYFTVLAQRCP